MATKIKIKKSQLKNMINEQMELLIEQEDNKIASKVISNALSKKVGENPEKIKGLVNDITTSKSSNELKEKIVNKYGVDVKDIEKLNTPINVIVKRNNKNIKDLYKWLSAIVAIVGIVVGIATFNSLPVYLAAILSSFLTYKSGKDPGTQMGHIWDKNYSPKNYMTSQQEKDLFDKSEEERKKKLSYKIWNTEISNWFKK